MERHRLLDQVAQEAVDERRDEWHPPVAAARLLHVTAGYLMSGTAVSFLKASKTCLDLVASHSTADSPVLVR